MGKWQYGVVLDAGSSGTRVHIYRWLNGDIARAEAAKAQLHALPVLETHGKWTKKTHPGISTFGDKPELVGPDHLQPLLDHALKIVPSSAVAETPFFLLATAGIRLLSEHDRTRLLDQICREVQTHTNFLLPDCKLHIQAIPGDTEGLYGWLAANYLLGGFDSPDDHDHGKGHHTYGFLDMGGASAQIAFVPNATESQKHANDLKLVRLRNVDGQDQEHCVFTTTWLRFGAREARKRYLEALIEAVGKDKTGEIPDPCLPSGVKMTIKDSLLLETPTGGPYLIGTGRFEECLKATYPLLDKDAPCKDQPCLLHGVHTPALDFEVNHFIGVSEYWHSTHEIFEMSHEEAVYNVSTYQQRADKFCQQDWAAIEKGVSSQKWGKKVDEQSAYEACFKASWLINMLHVGIGVPRQGIEVNGTSGHPDAFLEPFQAVNKIKHTEVSWTLGKMVLYASSQVRALGESGLPVGFGSNDPAVHDFQVPGATAPSPSNNTTPNSDHDSIGEKIHTGFFENTPRRIPGLILFMLILLLILFYFCGGARRSKIHRYICGSNPKKRRTGWSLFGLRRSGPVYERVLEEGDLGDPDSYELDDVDDDSEPDQPLTTPGGKSPRKNPQAARVVQDAIDRRGLVVRTESRERLALQTGRKSRAGSPARMKLV